MAKQKAKKMERKYLKSTCDFINGVTVKAKWRDYQDETSCLLIKDGSIWYLLQDRHDGSQPSKNAMKDYKYSWSLGSSWSEGQADIVYMYIDNEVKKPLTIQIASDTWNRFEESLKKVKEYGATLNSVDNVNELSGKLLKLIK